MSNPPTYIGSAEACERLGIDRSTLSRWVALGKVAPAMKLPGRQGAFLFDPQHIEDVRNRVGSAA